MRLGAVAGTMSAGLVAVAGSGLASCDTSPLGGGDASTEERALIALLAAFDSDDCATVIAGAEGFVASTDLRLRAVQTLYGRCLYRGDDDAGAELVLSRVVGATDAWGRAALYYRGRARAGQGAHAGAAEDFATYGARFPHDFRVDDARYQLGRSHAELGELDLALADFDAVIAMPSAATFRVSAATYRAGLVLFERAAGDPASVDLEEAFGRFATVVTAWPEAIHADDALYRQGRVRLAQGRFDEARTLFAEVVTRFPEGSAADAARYYEGRALYEAASATDDSATWTRAEAVLAAALADLPAESSWRTSAAYHLGRARYALERFPAAIEAFAIDVAAPASVYADNAVYYTGRCWYRIAFRGDLERYATAITWFERLLAEFPTSSYADDARYFAARAHDELGDADAARDGFEALLVEHPDSGYVDDALGWLVRIDATLGDCDAAAEALGRLEAIAPPSPELPAARSIFASRCGG